MLHAAGLFGIVTFLFVAWAGSSNRRAIHWPTVGWGMGLQWALALVVLKGPAIARLLGFLPWPAHAGWGVLILTAGPLAAQRFAGGQAGWTRTQGRWLKGASAAVLGLALLRGDLVGSACQRARRVVEGLMGYATEGAAFVFGPLAAPAGAAVRDAQGATVGGIGMVFAFAVLPTIIFVASIFAVLYHVGAMPWLVGAMARAIRRFLKVSGAESLCVSASILMGQAEAPLAIRPYLSGLTRSELMVVMTSGMAHVSGAIMVAYVQVAHVDVAHLLTAVLMTAPGAIVVAKILEPETAVPATGGGAPADLPRTDANLLDAAARGAGEGLNLALNVGAMLIAFIALVALVDGSLRWAVPGLSLARILGWAFSPAAFLMGVPWGEARAVGGLLGTRMVLNEFVAFVELGRLTGLSAQARLVSTFALCGFANFSSIAIQVGGIGALAPERRGDLARLGFRAMLAGTLANFLSACIAGILG